MSARDGWIFPNQANVQASLTSIPDRDRSRAVVIEGLGYLRRRRISTMVRGTRPMTKAAPHPIRLTDHDAAVAPALPSRSERLAFGLSPWPFQEAKPASVRRTRRRSMFISFLKRATAASCRRPCMAVSPAFMASS